MPEIIESLDSFTDHNNVTINLSVSKNYRYHIGIFLENYICKVLNVSNIEYQNKMIQFGATNNNKFEYMWFNTEKEARVAFDWLASEFLIKKLTQGEK